MTILIVLAIIFLVLVIGLSIADWTSDPERIDEEEKAEVEEELKEHELPHVLTLSKREDFTEPHV